MKINSITSIIAAMVVSLTAFANDISEIKPILIGSEVPEATIENADGHEISLADAIASKPTILVFYRGGWCPYCNLHLQELAESEAALIDLGYQIIALSPDSPESLKATLDEKELSYQLYSDSSFSAADAFGISYSLDDETLKKYKGYGIDLEKTSGGKNTNKLPVSSVFIITGDNEVSFSYVDPNYKFRVSKEVLLAAAKSSLSFHQ